MGEHIREVDAVQITMLDIPDGYSIFVITGYSDLRKGINGLCEYVDALFGLNPYGENVFLFCGRRADRFKMLSRSQDGCCILVSVVLDEGRLKWPRGKEPQAWRITRKQLNKLLAGTVLNVEDILQCYGA